MDIHGDAAAVVLDRNGIILVQGDPNVFGETSQCFIHGVICYFPDEMVEAFTIGRADIHPRAFADGFEAFQYLNGSGGI